MLGLRERRLLELFHDVEDLSKVNASSRAWRLRRWLGDWDRWGLMDGRLGLLLSEHADCPLEIGHGCLLRRLLGRLWWGRRLLLLPGLNDFEQVGNVKAAAGRIRLRGSCCGFRVDIGEVAFLSSLDVVGQFSKGNLVRNDFVGVWSRRFLR